CPPIFPDCVSLADALPGEEGRGALMTRADVIVVGGGVNGASTAFHLASRGVKNVLLLERRHLGAGATGKSGSLVRMHYTNEPESKLAFESLKIFRDFRNVVGGDCGIETGCEVTRVLTERGRVVGVETAKGRVDAPVVVLVPGAWAAPLLTPLGLDFGLAAHRIQITIFRWPAGFKSRHCVVIDAIHQSWFRPEGAATTLIGVELGAGHADPNAFDEG